MENCLKMRRYSANIKRLLLASIVCVLAACTGKESDRDFHAMVQPVPETARMVNPDYFIWCGTMVKDDAGTYHLFYSRWKKELGFNSWVTHSEVAHATADTPFGPFTQRDVALPVRGAEYWDGLCTHNPTVHRFGNKYYLYYMGNTGDGTPSPKGSLNFTHRNNQRIGVAVADTPDGPWERFDQPLIDVSADSLAADALMISNPAITECPDGSYLMVYKAVGKHRPMPFGGPVVHLTATAKSPTGPFTKQMKPTFTIEGLDFPAEDPYVWCENGKFYALVKDMKGAFTQRGKSLAMFESDNGLDWSLATHPFAMGLELRWESGKVEQMSNLERPQLLFEHGKPTVLLLAAGKVGENGDMECSYNVQVPLR